MNALTAGAAVLTTAVPTDAEVYSAFVFARSGGQPTIYDFVNSATASLDIEELELSDSAVVNAIVARAKAGVAVRVTLENSAGYASEVSAIKAAGGHVVGYSDPNGFYIHAEAMVSDCGRPTQQVEAGSMNISSNSLNNNRELGLILTGTGVANTVATTVETTFSSDYAGGTPA